MSSSRTEQEVREAGNDLDYIVAERVFGWSLESEHDVWRSGEEGKFECFEEDLPEFSTMMGDARLVVEAMFAQPIVKLRVLRLVSYPYNRTYASFNTDQGEDEWTEANGHNHLPLAICLAALDALAATKLPQSDNSPSSS